jgi:hypothetical protein
VKFWSYGTEASGARGGVGGACGVRASEDCSCMKERFSSEAGLELRSSTESRRYIKSSQLREGGRREGAECYRSSIVRARCDVVTYMHTRKGRCACDCPLPHGGLIPALRLARGPVMHHQLETLNSHEYVLETSRFSQMILYRKYRRGALTTSLISTMLHQSNPPSPKRNIQVAI